MSRSVTACESSCVTVHEISNSDPLEKAIAYRLQEYKGEKIVKKMGSSGIGVEA